MRIKRFQTISLAKLLTRTERTADGKLFSSMDVIAGRVREVTNAQGEREYRRWKPTKGVRRMMAGLDAVRSLCGATTRSGQPCKRRAIEGRKRCRNHGGLSTGPKTAEGRARIAESNRRRANLKNLNSPPLSKD